MRGVKNVLLFVISTTLMLALTGCSTDAEVPSVIGQKADEAEAALEDAGFYKIELVQEDGSAAYVASLYTVLEQDPQAGSQASKSDVVTLTVRDEKKAEKEAAAEEAKAKAEEEEQAAAEAKTELDGLVGTPATQAYDRLVGEGYTVTVLHAASKLDFTEEFKIDGLDWIVTDYDNLDVKESRVTIYIDTQEDMDKRAAADKQRAALEEKLPASYAWAAVKAYGDQEYPYGFKLHNIVGVLAEEPKDESTWFIKVTCDVTNAAGAKEKDLTCEAEVTGTADNPRVTSFTVY